MAADETIPWERGGALVSVRLEVDGTVWQLTGGGARTQPLAGREGGGCGSLG